MVSGPSAPTLTPTLSVRPGSLTRRWLTGGACARIIGKIPTFIYYDADGTELERVALDDKTPEELAAVRPSPPPPPHHHHAAVTLMISPWGLQMLAEKGIHPAEDGGGSSNVDDNSRQL